VTALVLADLHLGENPRDDYRHRFMRALPEVAAKLLPDRIIILGDLTEEKDHHSAWLTNRIADYMTELARVCKVIVQMGNHDYISVDDPFFQFIGKFPGVTFISRPTAVDINGLGLCMFLPHTRNYKGEWDMKSWPDHLDWIFAHQTFQGADVGFGHHMDGIPLSIFGPKDRVISGDVHVPQTLKQVTYVGAPYTIDFGDDYKPRMLLVDKKGFKAIPCHGPQKRLIEINSTKDLGKRDLMRGDILKIRFNLLQEEVAEWPETQRRIKAWAYDGGYQLFACIPVLEQSKGRKRVRVTKEDNKTDTQIVQEFSTHRDVDERTTKTGLWLMDKSK
jgi:DNA repair exonuclease SbcCD nuclease subunit